MADEIVLHHYDTSPFSEKVRVMLGVKGLSWRSVIQPVIMPKPELVPLTGGYRRIPVLQIGADVYCDTQVILAELESRQARPAVVRGADWAVNLWADRLFFQATVGVVFGEMGVFQQPNPMARMHAEIERLITASGLESTFIRPGMFASNAQFWWGPTIREGDVVRWPYGGAETAPIDERDVAAVVARALSEDGHAGGDYVLTGPESLSQAEQVSEIGGVVGRQIRFEELSPEEFRRETAGTWPDPVVEMLLAAWGATIGRPAFVTSTVADVVGTPARTFRQWVSDHADAFRRSPPE